MLARFAAFSAVTTLLLSCVSPAGASPLAYIANSQESSISVVDTDTNAVVTTVGSGGLYPAHVVVNATGSRVYVTGLNSSPPSVSVLNTLTNVNVAVVNIPVLTGNFFTNLILSPSLPLAYLGAAPDKIFRISTATNSLGTTITVPVSGGDEIGGIAVSPNGAILYATKFPSGDISVIDAATGLETTTIPGGGLGQVVVDPTGAFVYAVHESLAFYRNVLVKSSTASNTVVDTEDYAMACTGIRSMAVNAAGTTLYASCAGTGTVAVVDTATLAQTPVTVGAQPAGVSLMPDGSRLYVANNGSDDVSVVSTASNTVIDTIPVGDGPQSVGAFIGPDFVCGNGTLDPGEGCDDGNLLGGDGCNASCYTERDDVVAQVKPFRLTIPAGDPSASKTLKVQVRNAQPADRSVTVIANTTTCTGAYGTADFGGGINSPVSIPAGKSVKGLVTITASANTMFQLNHKAPIRCTFTVTAYPNPTAFMVDANPSNNVATFEVDIVDEAQVEQTTTHESTIAAVKPLKLKIKDGTVSVAKVVKFKAGNADYLPTAEAAPSHPIAITALDGNCPAMTAGAATIGGGASADVEGGKTAKGAVTLTIPAAGVSSPSKASPARCVATLTAVGPPGDSMPANDTTTVVLDIVDGNDF